MPLDWRRKQAVRVLGCWLLGGDACAAPDAPVYEWFTEGFDTRDLKEAKALLDQL